MLLRNGKKYNNTYCITKRFWAVDCCKYPNCWIWRWTSYNNFSHPLLYGCYPQAIVDPLSRDFAAYGFHDGLFEDDGCPDEPGEMNMHQMGRRYKPVPDKHLDNIHRVQRDILRKQEEDYVKQEEDYVV